MKDTSRLLGMVLALIAVLLFVSPKAHAVTTQDKAKVSHQVSSGNYNYAVDIVWLSDGTKCVITQSRGSPTSVAEQCVVSSTGPSQVN